jgi:hypothetical protein
VPYWPAVAYSFDEIKGAITLLTALYSDVNAAELAIHHGKPAVSRYVLDILGVLRQPLSDDDKRRFDLVVDRIVEAKLRAGYLP